jgi:hypothetical protein
MLRRSKWLALLLLVGGVSVCFAVVGYLAKRQPDFYATAEAPSDSWESRERAAQLVTRVQDLKNEIRSKSEWGDTFTAEDLNCFFLENMNRESGLCSMLPKGLHSPRVAIDGDRIKLGFKYGEGFWSTVVWVELRVWLVENEVNLIGVEVCDLRSGSLPVGAQSILDSISEAARNSNIEVTWYRNGSNPVGLFRLYADQPQPNSQVLTLDVADGKITVAGRSFLDHSPAMPVALIPLLRGPAGN